MSDWPSLSELLVDRATGAPVGLLGAPLAAGSVTAGSCDRAPALLRATLKRISRYDVETARELSTNVADRGDADLDGLTIEQATPVIQAAVGDSSVAHALTLLVGGNNAALWLTIYALGARYMTLTHNVTLDWADAALDTARHDGLTEFGKEVGKRSTASP